MVEVTRTFTVATGPREVVEYLKDFGNATDWDPGTQSCERLGSGPVAVGARWHNVSKIAGVETELTYELTRLEPRRGSSAAATTPPPRPTTSASLRPTAVPP
ncbi:SRPBCC family protein [Amycolatopsis carbonis]|uniref:SRPBCC family protein n=1 Tax=Amycolatopsis carbonis TaxID=715471 RepID=A0A9Y2MU62_9PSEU|nr:SRPBCC family protein [Amycolatopsis sp. 2-15]WIX75594.1 SRPBCC family protein [Amycolatopsis sp. 2-15]